mgnify:CR=1 FL=1
MDTDTHKLRGYGVSGLLYRAEAFSGVRDATASAVTPFEIKSITFPVKLCSGFVYTMKHVGYSILVGCYTLVERWRP